MRVKVEIRWGDDVLRVCYLGGRSSFSLGEWPSDFAVPREVLGTEHLRIVRGGGGPPQVHLPAAARSVVVRRGDPGRARLGDAYRESSEPRTVLLDDGDAVAFEIGTLRVDVQREDELTRTRFRRFVVEHRCWLGGAPALLVATFLGCAAYALPGMDPEAPRPHLQGQAERQLPNVRVVTAGAEAEFEPPMLDLSKGTSHADYDLPGLDCRCLCTGSLPMGDPNADADDGRYGVAGPGDNPDPHLGRRRGDEPRLARPRWLGAPTAGAVGDQLAPVAAWGRDSMLGVDPAAARGGAFGPEVRSARGGDDGIPRRVRGGLEKVLTLARVEPLPSASPVPPPAEQPRRRVRRARQRWEDLYPCVRRRVVDHAKRRGRRPTGRGPKQRRSGCAVN